jgi:hypothetical protein
MRVRVKRNDYGSMDYRDLTVGNVYMVIGIEGDDFRIISDEGLPYLYPTALFEVTDSTEPADWLTEYGDDGRRYSYPPEIAAAGFFEDYFEGKAEAATVFRRCVARIFGRSSGSTSKKQ